MKKPIEFPPILAGDEQNQILQLRDFLVRLVQQLNEEENKDA